MVQLAGKGGGIQSGISTKRLGKEPSSNVNNLRPFEKSFSVLEKDLACLVARLTAVRADRDEEAKKACFTY